MLYFTYCYVVMSEGFCDKSFVQLNHLQLLCFVLFPHIFNTPHTSAFIIYFLFQLWRIRRALTFLFLFRVKSFIQIDHFFNLFFLTHLWTSFNLQPLNTCFQESNRKSHFPQIFFVSRIFMELLVSTS